MSRRLTASASIVETFADGESTKSIYDYSSKVLSHYQEFRHMVLSAKFDTVIDIGAGGFDWYDSVDAIFFACICHNNASIVVSPKEDTGLNSAEYLANGGKLVFTLQPNKISKFNIYNYSASTDADVSVFVCGVSTA